MNEWKEVMAYWLCEVYLLATLFLAVVCICLWRLRQPLRRLSLAWGDDLNLRVWSLGLDSVDEKYAVQSLDGAIALPDGNDEMSMQRFEMRRAGGAFVPNAKTLVLRTAKNFYLFDVASGNELRMFPGDNRYVLSTAFSRDGKRMLTSGLSGPIRLRDLTTGTLLLEIDAIEEGSRAAALSPDGRIIAAATRRLPPEIRFFDVPSG